MDALPGMDRIDALARRHGATLRVQPTPLLPTLAALHAELPQGARLVVADVVWQTAPTPELARAFNAPGAEKVRPIEGYEMQLEHAGFRLLERLDLRRDDWLAFLPQDDPRRPAVEADARGALRACAWATERE